MEKNLPNMRAVVRLTSLGKYNTVVWEDGNLIHLVIPGNKYKKLSQRLCKKVYDASSYPKYRLSDEHHDTKVIKILCGR